MESCTWTIVTEESVSTRQWPVIILLPPLDPICPQLSCAEFNLFRIQYLPKHEKYQVQNFHNWVHSDLDTTTRSAPESPIIGFIKSLVATCHEAGTSRTSKESTPKVRKSLVAEETATAAADTGGSEAGGSGKSTIRVVPFQSLPQSAQEELGKELFDDPLLTVENVKKLADYMQWSFKFTKVRFPLSYLC